MPKSAARKLAWLTLTVVLSAAVARLACFQGWLVPVRVVSASMSPALNGPGRQVVCGDCGQSFHVAAASPPLLNWASCPNCGYRFNAFAAAAVTGGDRVLIDRLAYRWQTPRRWQLMVAPDPSSPGELAVKRVVGLPGERIDIRSGDVYADGRIVRKSLDELLSLAIPVHAAARVPQFKSQGLPPRWAAAQRAGWQLVDPARGRWWNRPDAVQQPTAPAEPSAGDANPKSRDTAIDWLTYRHWPNYAAPVPRSGELPVTDSYACNQGLSRALHEVSDLLVEFRFRSAGSGGTLHLFMHDGRDVLQINWSGQSATVLRNDDRLAEIRCPRPAAAAIQFGVCDQQLLLGVDRRELLRVPYDHSDRPWSPVARPIGIGAWRLACEVDTLVVYRDLYYLAPDGLSPVWRGRTMTGDEYFLLGDNAPVSHDSRHWAAGSVRRAAILGKPIRFGR